MAGVRHTYQSATPNNPSSEISSDRWNEDHTIDPDTITREQLEPDLRTELDGLAAADASLDGRLDTAEADIDQAESDIVDHEGRITTLEGTVGDHETRLDAAENDIDVLQGIATDHESRIQTLEAASHAAVTLAGTPDYITIAGQVITRRALVNADIDAAAAIVGSKLAATLAITTALSAGSNPSASGSLRIPNASTLSARNGANGGDVPLIGLDASDIVVIGDSGSQYNIPGGRVIFPSTQVASSNSNTLDDYEEGTWTATDQSGAGLSLTSTGTYIKIGRLVFLVGRVTYPSTGDGSSALIGGLPFTSENFGSDAPTGLVVDGNQSLGVRITNNATTLKPVLPTSGNQVSNSSLSGRSIYFGVTYRSAN